MLDEGRYFVWFNTPLGQGAGEVQFLPDGSLIGGDTNFAYSGCWRRIGPRFKAEFCAQRIAPGPPGVFGLDKADVVVSGIATGDPTISGTGFAKQAPGLQLNFMLNRMDER
ncbi:MAG: hypothetical protein J0H71_06780 [Rhizobiales bacterium]|nr:hypothetical protein [Hyphomicrobiales bacterium]